MRRAWTRGTREGRRNELRDYKPLAGRRFAAARSSAATSSSTRIGLLTVSSIPAAMQTSRSPCMALAVIAMMGGRCPAPGWLPRYRNTRLSLLANARHPV
jgi:hypothetical protein